ncbi:hypothetical protein BST61_g2019 [Cercospora zeina]
MYKYSPKRRSLFDLKCNAADILYARMLEAAKSTGIYNKCKARSLTLREVKDAIQAVPRRRIGLQDVSLLDIMLRSSYGKREIVEPKKEENMHEENGKKLSTNVGVASQCLLGPPHHVVQDDLVVVTSYAQLITAPRESHHQRELRHKKQSFDLTSSPLG